MFDEPFAHGRSLVHAVDPRFRLVAAFVCAVCLAVVRTPEAAWFGFGMAALLLALSRPPMRPCSGGWPWSMCSLRSFG